MRVLVLLVVLAGCDSDNMTAPTDECSSVAAAILFPSEGAKDVPRMLETRVQWTTSSPTIRPSPVTERFLTLTDDTGYGNYTPLSEQVMPDGTIITQWGKMAANTGFTLDVGWWCVSFQNNCAPVTVPLGTIGFTTGVN
jgi:hypothetical protein